MKFQTAAHPVKNRFRRPLLLAAGSIALAAGIVGIFVPLWPTTCFLLAAAACFSKSSDRLHSWMMTNRLFGRHLTRYRQEGTVESRVCWGSLAMLWFSLAGSLIIVTPPLWASLLIIGIGVGVTVHLWQIARVSTRNDRSGIAGNTESFV